MRKHVFCAQALIWACVLLLAVSLGTSAQGNETNGAFSRAELDQMFAPIALYPDSLLAQVLIAATYPDQVAEADHWVKAHPNLKGEALNAELDNMNWDLSVKALMPFPQVLAMMDEHINWTAQLGQAFMGQQRLVMREIQRMRHKAYAAGNLRSTKQQRVVVAGESIEIEPAESDVVYVPYYDPEEIYGSWWWPDYPPFAWYPIGTPYITVGLFGFGWGVGVSPFWGWGWGAWNWGSSNVYININRTVNINNPNLNLKRNSLRTTNLTSVAARRVADPVRTAAERAGGRAVTSSGARAAIGHGGHFSRQSTSNREGVVSRPGSAGRISAAPSNTAHKSSAASLRKELHGGGGRTSTGNMARKTGGASRTTGNVSHRGLSNRDRDISRHGTSHRSSSMSRGRASHHATQHGNNHSLARGASRTTGNASHRGLSNRDRDISRHGTSHRSSSMSRGEVSHHATPHTNGSRGLAPGGASRTTGNVSHSDLSNRDRDIAPRSTFRSGSMSRGGATQHATQHMNSGSSLSSGGGGRGVSPGGTMHNGSFSGAGTRTGGGHVAGVPAGGGGHPAQSGGSPHKR